MRPAGAGRNRTYRLHRQRQRRRLSRLARAPEEQEVWRALGGGRAGVLRALRRAMDALPEATPLSQLRQPRLQLLLARSAARVGVAQPEARVPTLHRVESRCTASSADHGGGARGREKVTVYFGLREYRT